MKHYIDWIRSNQTWLCVAAALSLILFIFLILYFPVWFLSMLGGAEAESPDWPSGTNATQVKGTWIPSPSPPSPPSPSPPSPSPSPPVFAPVDHILKGLPWGNVAYGAPQSIPLSGVGDATLVLSPTRSLEVLKAALQPEDGSAKVSGKAGIQIAPRMKATLSPIAKSSLEILPYTETVQAVSYTNDTHWKWRILAKEEGQWELVVQLDLLLKVDDENTFRTITSFRDTLMVSATSPQRLANFWKNNWQWLSTTLAIPLLVLVWKAGGRLIQGRDKKVKGPVGFSIAKDQ